MKNRGDAARSGLFAGLAEWWRGWRARRRFAGLPACGDEAPTVPRDVGGPRADVAVRAGECRDAAGYLGLPLEALYRDRRVASGPGREPPPKLERDQPWRIYCPNSHTLESLKHLYRPEPVAVVEASR